MTLAWRIWYSDGSTFDNLQGLPTQAPGRGIVCVTTADPEYYGPGRYVHKGMDFYVWSDKWNRWNGVDKAGLSLWLHERRDVILGIGDCHKVWTQNKGWVDVDIFGLLLWAEGTGLVKIGEMVPGGVYRDIVYAACNDPGFCRKPPVDSEHMGNPSNGWLNG